MTSRSLSALLGGALLTLCACQAMSTAASPAATLDSNTGGSKAPNAESATASSPSDAGVSPAPVSDMAKAALEQEQVESLNTEIVTSFYRMIFHEHRVPEAIALYGGPVYIQHTPGAPQGWAALEAYLTDYFAANPQASSDIQHVMAQGDRVMLHVLAKDNPVDPGRAIVDIFRLENGKIVEHWDVVQLVPAAGAGL